MAVVSVRWRAYAYAAPAAAWAGVLLAFAIARNLGPLGAVQLVPQQDKLYHVVEYVVLAALIAFALGMTTRWTSAEVFFFSVSLSALYGLLLEGFQAFLPYRSASAMDALANAIGAAVGAAAMIWGVACLWRRKR